MITVALADDHEIVRHGLRLLLEAQRDLKLVGEAGNGIEALDLVERMKPAVLVADLMMPGLGGADVTREVARRWSHTRVVILSMHDDDAYVRQALQLGAAGYVLKDASAAELIDAIRAAAAGRRYLSPSLEERQHEILLKQIPAAVLDPYETLTNRERQMLHLSAEGLSAAQIAEQLFLSPRTVETHRANLMRKLGVRSQAELIRYALLRGILTSQPKSIPI
jgi:two-component system, NarL family, response regulator NreC